MKKTFDFSVFQRAMTFAKRSATRAQYELQSKQARIAFERVARLQDELDCLEAKRARIMKEKKDASAFYSQLRESAYSFAYMCERKSDSKKQ